MAAAKMSALKRWTLIFSALDVAFLFSGIFVIIISFMWKGLTSGPVKLNADLFLRLAVSDFILNSGIVFSIGVFISVLVSLWPLTAKPTREDAAVKGLTFYLFVMFHTALVTIGIGTAIWFSTLREKTLFLPVWQAQSAATQVFIQNTLSCCGWFNATDAGLFNAQLQTGFCQDPSSIPVNPDPNVHLGCQQPFVKRVDFILNNIFTTIYGFMVIQMFLILAAATLYNLRLQEKRFLRIDFKALGGKGGFV